MKVNFTLIDRDGKPLGLVPFTQTLPEGIPFPQLGDTLIIPDPVCLNKVSTVVVVERLFNTVVRQGKLFTMAELFIYMPSPQESWKEIAQAVRKGEFILR